MCDQRIDHSRPAPARQAQFRIGPRQLHDRRRRLAVVHAAAGEGEGAGGGAGEVEDEVRLRRAAGRADQDRHARGVPVRAEQRLQQLQADVLPRTAGRQAGAGGQGGQSGEEPGAASHPATDAQGGGGRKDGAYVAMERVTGTLHGRAGSFALVHRALMRDGTPQDWTVVVVPGSGTGALAGLEGSLRITVEQGMHFYDIEYTLPQEIRP